MKSKSNTDAYDTIVPNETDILLIQHHLFSSNTANSNAGPRGRRKRCSPFLKKLSTVTAILAALFLLNALLFPDRGIVNVGGLSDAILLWKRSVPEDIFQNGPFEFLPDYKNPCWKNKEERISCQPYFYTLGVPNVGYKDVFDRVVEHPSISQFSRRDVHWFSRKRFDREMPKLEDYLKAFQQPTSELVSNKNASGIHDMIFGECSDSTFWENSRWNFLPENADWLEPKYTTADYIYHLNPQARFIMMIRNPIDRVWSDFIDTYDGDRTNMQGVMGDFHKEVMRMVNITQQCLLKFPLRNCAYSPCPKPCKIDLTIGMYSVHLSEFLRWFPPTRLFTIKSEDYFKTVKGHLMKIYDFLRVKPLKEQELIRIARRSDDFLEKFDENGPAPMYTETRKALYDFYKPYNNELGRLLIQRLNYNREEIWWEEETEIASFVPK